MRARLPISTDQAADLQGGTERAFETPIDVIERVPEDELMDSALHAQAYADVDFSEPNSRFVSIFAERFPDYPGSNMLDLGCGPADIPMRFARHYPQATIVALDGANAMVKIAQAAVSREGFERRIDVRKWHIGREPSPVAARLFDAVVSNSVLHHIENPHDLWNAVRSSTADGARVLVMDLFRPDSIGQAEAIVERYAAAEPPIFKQDFMNSLLAAYRPDEIRRQIDSAGLASLRIDVVSDRHVTVHGVVERNPRGRC